MQLVQHNLEAHLKKSLKVCILQCLVYACQVEPDILELGVVALVKLLHNMARDFHGEALPLANASAMTFSSIGDSL